MFFLFEDIFIDIFIQPFIPCTVFFIFLALPTDVHSFVLANFTALTSVTQRVVSSDADGRTRGRIDFSAKIVLSVVYASRLPVAYSSVTYAWLCRNQTYFSLS